MEEYIDILDENGKYTGNKDSRNNVHKMGLWHKVVYVWILNDKNELLIQKRTPNKEKNPNMWTISCSGHLSAGDTSIDGALRELSEEIGLIIPKMQLEYLFTVQEHKIHNKEYIDNEFIDVYLINLNVEIEELKMQIDEVSEFKFIPFRELKEKINNQDDTIVEHTEMYNKLFSILENKL